MQLSRRRFLKQSALSATILGLGGLHCAKTKSRPNIILFFSDEMDPTYLGCYGGKIPTPNLDKLAAKGVRFTKAYTTAPVCTPSRYSVLTGKYPGRCAAKEFIKSFPNDVPYCIAWNTLLEPSTMTIPRILSQNGYLTGMAGKWHNSKTFGSGPMPKLHLDDDPADEQVNQKLVEYQNQVLKQICQDGGFDIAASAGMKDFDSFPVRALKKHNIPWITKGAVDFIKQGVSSGKPFFLYSATTAVHGPSHTEALDADPRYTAGGYLPDVMQYRPPVDEFKAILATVPEHEKHKYAGVMELDHHIGQVLQTLRDQGVEDNTVIFYMSDHNTEPGKATSYEKGNHIPMLMAWPGKIVANITREYLVQTVDIFPTIMHIAGVPVATDLDGVNILPAVRQDHPVRDYVYLESGYTRSVNDGRYKYIAFRPPQQAIKYMNSDKAKYASNHLNRFKQAQSQIAIEHYPAYFDPDQLYDLEKDPYEQNNVFNDPQYKEVRDRLQVELKKRLATFKHPFDLQTPEFMKTQKYRQLADNTRAIGTDYIEWLARDHGTIVWPPQD